MIVATPGRLQDLLDRRMLTLDAVEILVLDEADRMLDMGFKPQVDRIVKRLPRDRQTMFFSATLDGEVGELAHAYTQSPVRIEAELPSVHGPGDIEHRFVPVTNDIEGRPSSSSCSRPTAASPSCSCARSEGPTASPASSHSTASRPQPCTAT